MFEASSFGRTMDLLHRSLDVENLRRSVIADNLANSSTPHFKRTVVNFESQLKKALHPKREMSLSVEVPWRKRFPDYTEIRPVREVDFTTQADNNGNNVNVEQEMMLSVQNQMRYNLMVQAIAGQFQQMNLAIKG